MKRLRHLFLVLILLGGLGFPLNIIASGSYCPCVPKPPPKKSQESKVEREKYALGQKVFNAKSAPAAVTGDADAQRTRLQSLQSRLPEGVARKKDLPSLAGKLTPEQLDALEYFVAQRYPQGK